VSFPDIIEFVMSDDYLGKSKLSPAQRAILKAIYGLEMTLEEKLVFLEMTEGRKANPRGYDEAVIVCGMRGGKTCELGASIGTYEAIRWGVPREDKPAPVAAYLSHGQTAKGVIIAQNDQGASEARDYIEGNLAMLHERYGGILADTTGQEKAITGKSIRMAGPVEIIVVPALKKAVRAFTGLFLIADEVGHWETAAGAQNQDTKVMSGARSRFATLAAIRPKRIVISSPDEKWGYLWNEYSHRDRTRSLVVKAPTWVLHPKVDKEFLDLEMSKDPQAYMRDYGAEFADVGAGSMLFFNAETVDRSVVSGLTRIPPKSGQEYTAWIDAGFVRDRFMLAIAHRAGDRVIFDLTMAWTPKHRRGYKIKSLDYDETLCNVAEACGPYLIDRIRGDQFCSVPIRSALARLGLQFIEVPSSSAEKNQAMLNMRSAMQARKVDLLDDEIVIKDLKGLIKRTTQGGQMHIAAPNRAGCYDDAATVVSRLIRFLLPMESGVNVAEINASAMPRRDLPDFKPGEFGTDIMAAVY
jgi:hypothetical protein